jgi:hypothetical protein
MISKKESVKMQEPKQSTLAGITMTKEELQEALKGARLEVVQDGPDDSEAMLSMAQRVLDEKQARVNALISGQTPPADDFVEYLVTRCRGVRKELERVRAMVQKQNAALAAGQERMTRLAGELDGLMVDLEHWSTPKKEQKK